MKHNIISDKQVMQRAKASVKLDLEKKKVLDIPVAIYDRKTKMIYECNSDGTKVPVAVHKRGRYSERVKNID